jgi:ABC-type lipoprotein export system ATPase subunit
MDTAEALTPPAILAEGVERAYPVGDQLVHALRGIDLSIAPGQFIALKGRSGSGKTTLLNCLGGLDRPTAGAIAIHGRSLLDLDEGQLTHWRRSEVGFIFQSLGLLPTMSAYENVELMLRIARMPREERRPRALTCLELVGLGKWSDHRPYEMSGGQQQRVAIARAIANRPRLILADEPTGELDSETTREVLALFREIIHAEGMTMLMATHDDLAEEYVDEVLRLEDGRISASHSQAP